MVWWFSINYHITIKIPVNNDCGSSASFSTWSTYSASFLLLSGNTRSNTRPGTFKMFSYYANLVIPDWERLWSYFRHLFSSGKGIWTCCLHRPTYVNRSTLGQGTGFRTHPRIIWLYHLYYTYKHAFKLAPSVHLRSTGQSNDIILIFIVLRLTKHRCETSPHISKPREHI